MTPPSLREDHRRRTAAAIRRSAVRLSLEHGPSAVTVQQIADDAGVSQRTFFNYFPSKEAAVLPDLEPFDTDQVERFVRADEPDLLTALEQLMVHHVLHHGPEADEHMHTTMVLLQRHPELLSRMLAVFDGFDALLTQLVAERTGRPVDDLTCTVPAAVAMAALKAAVKPRRDAADGSPARPAPDATARHVSEAFQVLRGVITP